MSRSIAPKPEDHPRPDQVGALETIRGLGALIVLNCHLAGFFFPASFEGNPMNPQFAAEARLRRFPGSLLISGRFAVCLFFILSGVVLSLRYLGPNAAPERELAGAVVKRLFRLLPMVFVTVLLTLALGRAGLLFHQEIAAVPMFHWLSILDEWGKPPFEILRQIWRRPIIEAAAISPPLYTIGLEIQGSFLIFGVLFLLRHVQRHWWILGATLLFLHDDVIAAFVAGLMLAELFQTSPSFRTWAARPVTAIPMLLLGMWMATQQRPFDGSPGASDSAPLLPAIQFGFYGWQLVGAILVMAVVLGCPALLRALDFPMGRWIGSISYGLYAIHFTVLSSLGCWLVLRMPGGPMSVMPRITAVAACLVVSLAAGWALRDWVDRPSQVFANWVAKFFIPPAVRSGK